RERQHSEQTVLLEPGSKLWDVIEHRVVSPAGPDRQACCRELRLGKRRRLLACEVDDLFARVPLAAYVLHIGQVGAGIGAVERPGTAGLAGALPTAGVGSHRRSEIALTEAEDAKLKQAAQFVCDLARCLGLGRDQLEL